MDIDQVKENIQPLISGRNASILQSTLTMDPAQLMIERKELEMQIRNYQGDDPLEPWCKYINWIEQSYPSSGKESGFQEALEKLLLNFENDERYYQDRRMVKLYIKLLENRKNSAECYQQLYNAGIGTMVADFYIAWAYCYDLVENHVRADEIFRKGIECRAEPLEELKEAHHHFGFTVAQRIMHKDNMSIKEETNRQLNERRLALSSLRSYSRKQFVPSLRTGPAIKKTTPGHVQINKALLLGSASQSNNATIKVYSNENDHASVTESNASQAEENKSVVRCIVDSIREQENVKEPGPWTGVVSKNRPKLFHKSQQQCNVNFEICVQDDIVVPVNELNINKPFKYPENFISKNLPQESWITPVTTEETSGENILPHYIKFMLYPRPNQEFSLEEYKAFKWMMEHKKENNFIEKHKQFWNNGPHINCRLYPNFAKKSLPQQLDELDKFYIPPKSDSLILNYNEVYNAEEEIELQLEEILAYVRYAKQNQTIVRSIDMEETICEPSCNMKKPRKSFYPMRKSLAPTKCNLAAESCNNTTDIDKRIHKTDKSNENLESKQHDAQFEDSSKFSFKIPVIPSVVPASSFSDNVETVSLPQMVVMPSETDVVKPKRLPFEIFEDTVCKMSAPSSSDGQKKNIYFDIDETCSTQAFCNFLKPSAVSTPMAPVKLNPSRACSKVLTDIKPKMTTEIETKTLLPTDFQTNDEQKSTVVNDGSIENADNRCPIQTETVACNTTDMYENIISQQDTFIPHLSPIMETSEQGTLATPTTANALSTGIITPLTTTNQNYAETNLKPIIKISSADKLNSMDQNNCTSSDKSDVIILDDVTSNIKHLHIKEKVPNVSSTTLRKTPALQTLCVEKDTEVVHPVEDSIVKVNQVGNFSRLEQKESTLTDLKLSTVPLSQYEKDSSQSIMKSFLAFQQDKTDTIPNIKLLLNQKESTPLKLENFEIDVMEPPPPPTPTMPPPIMSDLNTTQSSSKKTCYDDIFELFALSPTAPTSSSRTNKWDLSTNKNIINNNDENILTNTFLKDFCNVKEPPPPPSCTSSTSSICTKALRNVLPIDTPNNCGKNANPKADSDNQSSYKQEISISTAVTPFKLDKNKKDNHEEIVIPEIKETKANDVIRSNEINSNLVRSSTSISHMKKMNDDKESGIQEGVLLDTIDILDDSDNNMSIYYKESPKTPIGNRHQWNCNSFSDENNDEYTHPVNIYHNQEILDCIPLDINMNPFNDDINNGFLQKISFTRFIESLPNCQMKAHIPQLKSKTTIQVNDTKFEIIKLMAEGSYGTIFRAKNLTDGLMYALKQEKPPNNWEYYICLEIEARLNVDNMLPAFMSIDYALIGNNASVLISPYSPYGSFIAVCNHIKKYTMKNLNEYVVMLMGSELLDIFDHLHSIKIIHGDVKADNFLLMNKLSYPTKHRSIKLIDFGEAIDMKICDPKQTFKYVHQDESIRCIEMREGRPWTYQLDLFGLAGVLHVLLFGKYMEVKKTEMGKWTHTTYVPRYFHRTLWETIFNALLNIRDCNSMPNLQELRALLKEQIEEKDTFALTAMAEFNMILMQM